MILDQKWDTAFFGRKIGKIDIDSASALEVRESLDEALEQKFRYLTCRLMASEIALAQLLEKHGFYLIDMGVVLEKRIEREGMPQIRAREGNIQDIETLRSIAAGTFKGTRFYQDPFFTEEEADRLYQAWAENSVKGLADKVLLIKNKGFITCKVSGETGAIPLVAVSFRHQGKGIGTALLQNALWWFTDVGIRNVTVRTQAGNGRTVKFYEDAGFKVKTIDVTMGKILEP